MAATWTRTIVSMMLALGLAGAAYGHCASAIAEHPATAAHMSAEHMPRDGMAVPSDCDGCDHKRTIGDLCFIACGSTAAIPEARAIGVVAAASQAMIAGTDAVLTDIDRPPDPHPPNLTVPA